MYAVKRHLKRDPSLPLAKSGGHNRTFLWEATRGKRVEVVRFLLHVGADPNIPGRTRSEIPVLVQGGCGPGIGQKLGERNAVIRPQEPAADRMDFFNGLLKFVESQQLSRSVNAAWIVVTDDVFRNKRTSLTREASGMANTNLPAITRSRLVSDLSKLGLAAGDTLMLHASVKGSRLDRRGP